MQACFARSNSICVEMDNCSTMWRINFRLENNWVGMVSLDETNKKINNISLSSVTLLLVLFVFKYQIKWNIPVTAWPFKWCRIESILFLFSMRMKWEWNNSAGLFRSILITLHFRIILYTHGSIKAVTMFNSIESDELEISSPGSRFIFYSSFFFTIALAWWYWVTVIYTKRNQTNKMKRKENRKTHMFVCSVCVCIWLFYLRLPIWSRNK